MTFSHLISFRPNIFVGSVANSALYSKWYFEVAIDHVEQQSDMAPHFRVGWGNTSGYIPYPGNTRHTPGTAQYRLPASAFNIY